MIPRGFQPVTRGAVTAWVRRDLVEDATRAGLLDPDRLAARALARHQGRGTSWTIQVGAQRGVLRRYRHGGALRRLLGDRYRSPRCLDEAAVTVALRARGAPCPEPLAAIVEELPTGALRLALVTREVEGARAAPEALAARRGVRARRQALRTLALAVRAFHDAGGDHPDLNARNLLLDAEGRGWVLDLDRARAHPGPAPASTRVANLSRLARSWRKLDPTGQVVTPRDALAFAAAYAGGRLRGLPAGAPGAPPTPAFPAGVLYDLALAALSPLLAPLLAWWARPGGKLAGSWRDRLTLALPPRPAGGRPILVHGASVGEVNSATPLVAALREAFPGAPVVLSTLSETGQAAARRAGAADGYAYLPADLPGLPGRWLDHLAPRLVVVLETELWCGLFRAAQRRGIPLATANARIAPNRVERYQRLGALFGPLVRIPDYQGMQSEADRDRVLAVGAAPGRVKVPGDLKYDQVLGNTTHPLVERLGATLDAWGPRVVAGSVHPGEEGAVLDAFAAARDADPDLGLVLAPRHLGKAAHFAAACEARGLRVARRSRRDPLAGADVWLLDTHGELAYAYQGAAAAFIGGSLVPVGGHSPLEPAVLGVPVSFGPQAFNFAAIDRALVEAGAAVEVADAAALADEWRSLVADPALRARRGQAARAAVAAKGGACRTIAGHLRHRWKDL